MERALDQRRPRLALAVASAALAGACGSGSHGSGAGNPPGSNDDQAPLAVVHFPPDGCVTSAPRVTLAIAASDETGIELVRVAGFPAVLGTDSIWRVSVPLGNGFNTLFVETRDTLGNVDLFAALLTVRRESALWIEPSGLAVDVSTGDAVVLDTDMPALFHVQPSGARSLISGAGTGSGVELVSPRDVDVVASLGAAVVTDGALDAVLLVDLASGARRTLSSPAVGDGPPPLDLHGIAVDLVRNRALVLDAGRAELTAVDLATGRRSAISSGALGGGPSLAGARRLAFDPARNRALVLAASTLLAVDLASGERRLVSGGATGSGPAFVDPLDVAVGLLQDRAFVTDPGTRALLEVDLVSGARQIISSAAVGSGPDWLAPAGVAVRPGNLPLVIDSSLDALVEVVGGGRRIVSGISAGIGPGFVRPAAMASGLDSLHRLVVADRDELFLASAVDGTRELFSGAGRGNGLPFRALSAAGANRKQNRDTCILVLDGGAGALIEIDLLGNRRSIAVGFSGPRNMVLVPGLSICAIGALVVDVPTGGPAALLRVFLDSGTRMVVSDPMHGSGPDLVEPVALELDLRPLDAFAIVLDAGLRAIFSVDLVSGDREISALLPELGTPTDLALDGKRILVTVADPAALLVVEDGETSVVSGAARGSGPDFGRPVAVELLTLDTVGPPIAFVLDAARGALLAVDTRTGERVIRTK